MGKAITLRIRPARLSEREALEALQRRASIQLDDYREQIEANPDAISLPASHIRSGLVIVAEADGAVAGFAVVLPRSEGNADLDGVFVEPEMWASGVGRRLVEEASHFAIKMDVALLRVVASPQAVGFYQKLRFTECGVERTRFGDAVVMTRSLVF